MAHVRPALRHRSGRVLAATIGATLAVTAAVVVAPPAQAATRSDVLTNAATYAKNQGYTVGIAVLDTQTGAFRGAGDYTGTFASESLIKVFIATRLLLAGRMYGSTEQRAYKMITQSDDAIASAFYGSVGGDGLVSWMARHYHVAHLGYAPSRAGWWGNTHLHPDGLAHLYAKLKADRRVAPWLLNAMHHARHYGSDGFYQYFGIPSATTGAAIKQGWGNDYEIGSSADENSTGFVNGDRYAVVLMARGPSNTYGSQIGNLLTGVARRLMPNGQFPAGIPAITAMSAHYGSTVGGNRVTIYGHDFTNVTTVRFGRNYVAPKVTVLSPRAIVATAPRHIAIDSYVRVLTPHGITPVTPSAHYVFDTPPAVDSLSSAMGASKGGGVLTLKGRAFTQVTRVLFGSTPTTYRQVSRYELRVTIPKHAPGLTYVTVGTPYGSSPRVAADLYRFVDPPTIAQPAPQTGTTGDQITLTGTGFFGDLAVTVGGIAVASSDVQRVDSTKLIVTVPAHPGAAGPVGAGVRTPFGVVGVEPFFSYTAH